MYFELYSLGGSLNHARPLRMAYKHVCSPAYAPVLRNLAAKHTKRRIYRTKLEPIRNLADPAAKRTTQNVKINAMQSTETHQTFWKNKSIPRTA